MSTIWKTDTAEFEFSPEDGALIRLESIAAPGISPLMGEGEKSWHHPPRYWGKGFAVSSRGSARWHRPVAPHDPAHLVYPLDRIGLKLEVMRGCSALGLEERYRLTNVGDDAVEVGSLGISVPFRDVYPSAVECHQSAFHAHLWTGGANSWAWATRMNGDGTGWGLDLLEGELWSYSVESREHWRSSNVRGHLYLHLTDHARNAAAFGGQPLYRLASGEELEWRWRISWYESFDAFATRRSERDFSPHRLVAELGESLSVPIPAGAVCQTLKGCGTSTQESPGICEVRGRHPGIEWLELVHGERRSRAALLFHRPVEAIVRQRVAFILARQQAGPCEPTRDGAFLAYDRQSGLTEIGGAWGDWSDGRERTAMALLVQAAAIRGWAPVEAEEALCRYRHFLETHLLTPENGVRGGSDETSVKRLYNYPWVSEFLRGEYQRTGDMAALRRSADILEEYYENGGTTFLGFLWGVHDLIVWLQKAGEGDRAQILRDNVIGQARNFRELGINLPKHEVNYEQSMVAPLALLLLTAQRLLPDEDWTPAIRDVLAWLRAFGGKQPDPRLADIPIRHWDGFWFGRYRQWGDIFPHYWSVLSGAAYLEAAEVLPDLKSELNEAGERIFRANLVHFQEDGFASCAFIYPSCVDGEPAHRFDPLANDQDWSLVWLLRYADRLPWVLKSAANEASEAGALV